MNHDKTQLIYKKNKVTCANAHVLDSTCKYRDISQQRQIKGAKKNKKTTWIFLAVNVVIVAAIFIYQFVFKETKPLSELFAEKPFYRYFFIGLAILVGYYVASGLGYAILIKKTTGKFRLFLGIEFAIVGKYWDNITPFGTGGQFAQVAHGTKKGVSGDVTASIVVGKYMIGMIAFVLIGIAALFIPIDTFTSGTVIKILAGVGVGINLLITVFVWVVSVNRKLCSFIVGGGIKLLHKMHIIKNYNKALFRSIRFVRQYQKAFKFFVKSPLVFISEVVLSLIENVGMGFIAYMIYLAFNPGGAVSPVTILAMSVLCSFAVSYIPIPGGSGMAEISFAALFSKLFNEGATFWALIFWRIFTYYLLILVGFGFTVTDTLVSRRATRKAGNAQQKS